MCSTTTRESTYVTDLTLNMARTATSTLPMSCTCLVKSHQSNIVLSISRQITISGRRLFDQQSCSNASVRHVYIKECNYMYNTCNDASYSGNRALIQRNFNAIVTANWLIVSFTWNKCGSGSGATDLGHINIRGKTTVTHFLNAHQ